MAKYQIGQKVEFNFTAMANYVCGEGKIVEVSKGTVFPEVDVYHLIITSISRQKYFKYKIGDKIAIDINNIEGEQSE